MKLWLVAVGLAIGIASPPICAADEALTNVVVSSLTFMAGAPPPAIHADERDCFAFEYRRWEHDDTAWLYVKNRCTYRVHAVVEARTVGASEASSWTLMVPPRARMVLKRPNGTNVDLAIDSEASVYMACRAFRKDGEYYGIDPDDYSRCLPPENVP